MKSSLCVALGVAGLFCAGCGKKIFAGDESAKKITQPQAALGAAQPADAPSVAGKASPAAVASPSAAPSATQPPTPQAVQTPGTAAQPAQQSAAPAGPGASPVAIDRAAQVVVIGYHRLVDKVHHPDTEITPANFDAQMQKIKDAGISVIPMKDFLAWRKGEKNIPPRSAIITLDDGWNSAYATAWPILKKFGYPFTLFIYTDYVKGGPKSGGGSMSWEQLGEMRDAGAEIQSHTISHRDLRGRRSERGTPAYEEWLWKELSGSKEMLENRLGIAVTALALPYGYHNDHVREVAAKAGYEAVFTVYGQQLDCDTPMNSLGRFIIEANKPKVFADAIDFTGAPSSPAAVVAQVAPATAGTEPADGSEITQDTPLIKANLSSLGDVEADSVKMRVSGLGIVPAQYDPATKEVTYKLTQRLVPKEYTVFVSATAGGKNVGIRWSFKFKRAE